MWGGALLGGALGIGFGSAIIMIINIAYATPDRIVAVPIPIMLTIWCVCIVAGSIYLGRTFSGRGPSKSERGGA